MRAQQAGAAGNARTIGKAEGEVAALIGYAHVLGPYVAALTVDDGFGHMGGFGVQIGAHAAVIAEGGKAVRRQGADKIILGVDDVFHRFEGIQMLWPHGYQHADGGVDKVSQLLDILAVARAHFSQENLMRGLQPFADDAGKPHGGVETGRGGEHIVLLRKQGVEDDLDAGFAIAARDADADQILLRIQLALRVAHIHALNALFKRQLPNSITASLST